MQKASESAQSMRTAWLSDVVWYQTATSAGIILITISCSSK